MLLSRPAQRATGGARRSQSEDGGEGSAGSGGGGGDGAEWAVCAAPKKKGKSTQEERECEGGGWGRTGTAREGWVEVEVEREEDTGERGDPVPGAPPESRERKTSSTPACYTQCGETSQGFHS